MRLLSHPAVLASIGLLAVNDHLLRRIWPSALTGKLGDFCWLFFFPALLAAAATALAPTGVRRRPERILAACMVATGMVFVAAKALEPARGWVETAVTRLTGVRVAITQDPTDAVALVAFVPLWLLARRTLSDRPAQGMRSTAYAAITLGVVLSLANSAAPNFGIDCLSSDGDELQASGSSYDEVFVSRDGGLTWNRCPECSRTCTAIREPSGLIQHPSDPAVQYRYHAGELIERSQDGGITWSSEFAFEQRHEASVSLFYLRTRAATAVLYEGPLTGLVDPVSDNAVFAMGYEGVLLKVAATDAWEWVSVGGYEHMASPVPISAAETTELLYVEIRLSILLGLLAAATVLMAGPRHWIRLLAALLPWAAFAVTWAASPALNRSGYLDALVLPVIFAGYVAGAAHVLVFSRTRLSRRSVPRLMGVFIVAAALFLVPYVLWAYTLLPSYSLASLVALGTAAAVILIGRRLMR